MAKKNKKVIFGVLFVILNIIVIAIVGFTAFNDERGIRFSEIFKIWADNYQYAILAILFSFLALLLEGLKNYCAIYRLTKEHKFLLSMKTALIGKYYDYITPLASGGQPMQMYELNKGNVSTGISTSLPIANFLFTQIAFLICCITVFIFNSQVTDNVTLKITAYIGTLFSIIIPLALVLFSFMPRVFNSISNFFINLLHKIKLINNPEKTKVRIEKGLNEYRQSLKDIITSKSILLSQFIFSILYQISLCTIPFFVLKASGENPDWFNIFSLVIIVYAAVSFFPTPGNSGAAEISFGLLFASLTANKIFWTMTFWRFSSYYIVLIIGLIIIVYDYLIKNKKDKITNKDLNGNL